MPRVTVGIAFYNDQKWLRSAISSVLAQSFRDFELVLVDDGSTDESRQVALSFRDSRIRWLASDGKRRFIAARLNQLTSHARGEWVARMDADDVAHPERLREQVELMNLHPACDAVGTWVALVDERENLMAISESSATPVTPKTALTRGVFSHATMLAKRSWLSAHPYDERFTRAEDRDWWCRVGPTSHVAVIPKPLYVVRVRPTEADFFPNYRESHRQYRELLRRYGPDALGRVGTAAETAASHLKVGATACFSAAGAAAWLVRRRGRTPTPRERELVREALQCASEGAWPGGSNEA